MNTVLFKSFLLCEMNTTFYYVCMYAYLWLFGCQVLTLCPPLRNVSRFLVATESRPAREIDDALQITIKFTLEANNRTRVNTSYIFGHGTEKAYCSPSKAIIDK